MWFKRSMSIAQQLITIYNSTVHKNKSYAAVNVFRLFVPLVKPGRSSYIRSWLNDTEVPGISAWPRTTPTGHEGGGI